MISRDKRSVSASVQLRLSVSIAPLLSYLVLALVGSIGGYAQVSAPAATTAFDTIRLRDLSYENRRRARNLGDRMLIPGKERVILTGQVIRGLSGTQSPFKLTTEFPGKVRFEDNGANRRIIVFDGISASSSVGAPDSADLKLLESVLNDSQEAFLIGASRGNMIQLVGHNFRMDDGTAAKYDGPLYDVYEALDYLQPPQQAFVPRKFFAFNSATGLLELVRYPMDPKEAKGFIETHIQWQAVLGEMVPLRITRTENKQQIFVLIVQGATAGPTLNDGAFARP